MANTLMTLLVSVGVDTSQFKKGIKEVEGGVGEFTKSAKSIAKDVGVAFAAVGVAAVAVKKAWDMTGGTFVNYAEQVKNLSRNIGVSAENTSRLIQVADDVRISYESLGVAMKIAQKQGVDVSIDGLAKLADKYKQLQPGVERTQFLLKTFGRSGMEMGKLLEQGGAGVRKMSDAIDDNLIMTEKGIKASDDYQKSLDNFEDTLLGLQIAAGGGATTAPTNFFDNASDSIKVWTSNAEQAGIAWDRFSEKSLKVAAGLEKVKELFLKTSPLVIIYNTLFGKNTGAIEDNTGAVEDNAGAVGDNADALDGQKEAVKAAEDALASYKAQLDAVSQANRDAASFVQSYADFQKGYDEDHADAIKSVADAQEKLQEAYAKKAKTADQKDARKEAIEDAKTGLLEAGKAVQDLEVSWHESTSRMVNDMVLAKLSVDGLTDAEYKAYQQQLLQSGQITQAEADKANALMDSANSIVDGIALQEDVMKEKAATDAELLKLENDRAAAAGETTSTVVSGAAAQSQAIASVTTTTMIELDAQYKLKNAALATAAAYRTIPKNGGGSGGGYVAQPSNSETGNPGAGQRPQKRDSGGMGIAGTAYKIGVPEIFVPETNGNFIPLHGAGGKAGNTYNITVNNPKKEAAEDSIRKNLKNLSYAGAV